MPNRLRWLSFLLLLALATAAAAAQGPMTLWYAKPAAKWTEALPVGNGRLGAMVFGGTARERIQFNEDSLWAGEPHDYSHPGAADHLAAIRELLFEGKQREAERLAGETFMSVPLRQMPYQPFGDLTLEFPGHDGAEDYRRQLDLDEAVATTVNTAGGVTFRREVFASFPDQVIVVRVSADQPGKVTFSAALSSPHVVTTRTEGGSTLVMHGRVGPYNYRRIRQTIGGAIELEARLEARAEGGRVRVTGEGIEVEGADAATLLLTGATNYKGFEDLSADPVERCAKVLAALDGKPYEAIRRDHVADHRALFRRVVLDLGTTPAADRPTDERIKSFGPEDPQLAALYFQFGRYLMIAGSRPGSQPLNLQGIWNESTSPPWESKYTVNINTEMNYWPAEVCNLSECHEPLFDALEEVALSGRRTAKVHYDCPGWVLHHNFDLWRGTAPINASNHGIWPTGGAWLCQHFWMHWQFTRDREFLRRRAYPILKGASEFFASYLIEDPRSDKGWLISTPSNSPEQGGLVAGPTMDHQIIRSLFGWTIEASEILGVDEDFRHKLAGLRARIAPNQIGQYGQLQEWLEDNDNPNNHHRHVSHMWALHPGEEITRHTPDLFAAVRKSLEFRGDGGTGWSKAWKVNLWARLEEGDRAYTLLAGLIRGSTLPNMLDSCPPFQIDGNFGGTSGVAEMLLASNGGEVTLLPALPAAWPDGSVAGLCARGGLEVSITWKDGRAVSTTLKAKVDGRHRLRPPHGQQITAIRTGGRPEPLERDGNVTLLDVEAGKVYEVGY